LSARDHGWTFSVREFSETRPRGPTLQGVTLSTDQPAVMLREKGTPKPHLVPVDGGLALTGLFAATKLTELTLSLRLTHAGAMELYAAFGQIARLAQGRRGRDTISFCAELKLPTAALADLNAANIAQLPPVEQLSMVVKTHANLLQKLNNWELSRVAPVHGRI
jgi:hypothetical protein